jgi:hypothetical protein
MGTLLGGFDEARSTRHEPEIVRAGGGHRLKDSSDSKHNDVAGETWLHGSFAYVGLPAARKMLA